jgi:ABC-type transport system substrate-binding protein
MKKRLLRNLFSLTIITSFFLASCVGETKQINNLSDFVPIRVNASNCNYGGEIKSVASVDESTVRFTLCAPDAAFPAKIASPIFAIQEKKVLDETGGDSAKLSAKVNGTGPYTIASNVSTGSLQLGASSAYWGVPASTQLVVFRFMKNSEIGPLGGELSIADVSGTFNLEAGAQENLYRNSSFTQVSHTPLNVVYLGFNNKIKPMDNQIVRQAIATVINRDTLVSTYLPKGARTANQLIPLEVRPGHSDNLDWYVQDPNSVENLLASEGFNFSQELTLAYVVGQGRFVNNYDSMATEIKKELAAIRVRVALEPMSQDEFDKAIDSGSAMMFLNSFSALYLNGTAFYEIPFLRHTTPFGNPYTDIQAEIKSVQSELNPVRQQEQFDALNETFKKEVPFLPIADVPDWSFFNQGVTNASVNGYFESLSSISHSGDPITVLQADRPASLWPADETDYDIFRVTSLLYDTLVTYGDIAGTLKSDLADSWQSNADGTQWTFTLRYGVKFTDGAVLNSNDVVASFDAIWDAENANHKGHSGDFTIYRELFGPLLNSK